MIREGERSRVPLGFILQEKCQATLPELPMRTRDSLSPTSPTSYCR